MQPKQTLYSQLTELTTNDKLKTMFPNISTLANIIYTCQHCFCWKELLPNEANKTQISYYDDTRDTHLNFIISVWNRKPRRIAV